MRIPVLLAMVLVLACGTDAETPEEQVRGLLREAELAAEAKDAAALKELVSDAYRDGHGNDKVEVGRLLSYLLLRHTTVHLLVHTGPPEFPSPADARVRVFAAMAGTPLESFADLAGLRADLYRFDFALTLEDDGWRVVGAEWARARPEDLGAAP